MGQQSDIAIHGYTSATSVKPGDTLAFHVSARGTGAVEAQLVKLIHGDQHPGGPGFVEQELDAACNGTWAVTEQRVQKGNYLSVEDAAGALDLAGSFTLLAFVWPTRVAGGPCSVLSRWAAGGGRGYALSLDEQARPVFELGTNAGIARVRLDTPLGLQNWYLLAASYDADTGTMRVHRLAARTRYNSRLSPLYEREAPAEAEGPAQHATPFGAAPFLIGGRDGGEGTVVDCFNGKIDRPAVLSGALGDAALARLVLGEAPPAGSVVAYWDTAAGYGEGGVGDVVVDTGPYGLDAVGHNRPVRGQTGWNWNGRNDNFHLGPQEYGGIDFHDDALTDCRWQPTAQWTVPAGLKSGVYALRLRAGDAEEYLPVFVRAAKPSAPIAFLVPTASYLAYANALLGLEGEIAQAANGLTPVLSPLDVRLYGEAMPFGLSLYDSHADGAGVCYSSFRRPIYNMRPKYRSPSHVSTWQFPADLSIIGWLENRGYDYEVLTDEDLHRDGADALKPYRTVISGTHCEYYSERMLDATEDYVAAGGRFINLAGNGYYWVVGFRDDEPDIMEVRRLEAGTRVWQARPGEQYLTSTGERGGLWRHRGRPPQKIVGVGFTSEGMDLSVPYRRGPESHEPSASWIFEGVPDEVFGANGLARGGAVGLEIDRYDRALGSPDRAMILASSEPLTDNATFVQEELLVVHPGTGGTQHPDVRADMVYFKADGGGAVFSASSIAWGSALPWNNYDNDVSRLMTNLVDGFSSEAPLP